MGRIGDSWPPINTHLCPFKAGPHRQPNSLGFPAPSPWDLWILPLSLAGIDGSSNYRTLGWEPGWKYPQHCLSPRTLLCLCPQRLFWAESKSQDSIWTCLLKRDTFACLWPFTCSWALAQWSELLGLLYKRSRPGLDTPMLEPHPDTLPPIQLLCLEETHTNSVKHD